MYKQKKSLIKTLDDFHFGWHIPLDCTCNNLREKLTTVFDTDWAWDGREW